MNNLAYKRKPEKIFCRVIPGGFQPADQCATSQLKEKKLKVGDIVGITIKKLRSNAFNRLVHRIGQLVVANIDEFGGLDAHVAIKRLQIEGKIACDEIGVFVPGYGMVIQFLPRSMSYESMDQVEYHEAAKKICRLISDRYWPSLSAEQIEQMAEVMVDE